MNCRTNINQRQQARITELEARVAKLERGIGLAKVHFRNAEPTKAERMLDIAMGEQS